MSPLLIIFISSIISVFIYIGLKRLGKNPWRAAEKTLSYKTKLFEQLFERQTENALQKIKDGILEYQDLYHSTHKKRQEMIDNISIYEKNIQELSQKQSSIDSMSHDLNSILKQTTKVSKDILEIDVKLKQLEQTQKFLDNVDTRIHGIEENLIVQSEKAHNTIEQINQSILEDAEHVKQAQTEFHHFVKDAQKNSVQDYEENQKMFQEKVQHTLEDHQQKISRHMESQQNQLEKNIAQFYNKEVEQQKISEQHWKKRIHQELDAIKNQALLAIQQENENLTQTTTVASQQTIAMEKLITNMKEFITNSTEQFHKQRNQTQHLNNELQTIHSSVEKTSSEHQQNVSLWQQAYQEYETSVPLLTKEASEKLKADITKMLDKVKNLPSVQEYEEFLNKIEKRFDHMKSKWEQQLLNHENQWQDHSHKTITKVEQEYQEHLQKLDSEQRNFEKALSKQLEQSRTLADQQFDKIKNYDPAAIVKNSIDQLFQKTIEPETVKFVQHTLQQEKDAFYNVSKATNHQLNQLSAQKIQEVQEQLKFMENSKDTWIDKIQTLTYEAQQLLKNAKQDYTHLQDQTQKVATSIEKEMTTRIENQIQKTQDSILTHSHKQAQHLGTQLINEFNQQILTERQSMEDLQQEINKAVLQSKDKFDKQRQTTEQVEEQMNAIKKEIEHIQKEVPLINKTHVFTDKLHETVQLLSDRLQLAQSEAQKFNSVYQHFQKLHNQHNDIEKNIHTLTKNYKNFKLQEKTIRKLDSRLNRIDEAKSLAKNLEQKIEKITTLKTDCDQHLQTLETNKTQIQEFAQSFSNHEQKTEQAFHLANQLGNTLQKFDIRQKEIMKNISHLEKRSSYLQKLEGNILKVEARFEQMDTLLVDLEGKQKQTTQMGQVFYNYHQKSEHLMQELTSIIAEAEEKMDKLVSFYHVIDNMPEGQIENTEINLSTKKKNHILALHQQHRWNEKLIAEKLKIEPAIVKTVIATTNKS